MNDKKTPENIEFDIRGQICPSSLLTTLKELNSLKQEIKSGQVIITVKTDNRDATVTIPETATNMGYEV
ncbi:MAG: sulfurtransferase TusA family protein, partial [Desulfobulbaceae bacterium]|nr:sulfurtransferase TusA family protein [Desulfobulbaceae bacterium]